MNRNKVVAIIQARMGSSRLPGKVMKDLLGKPMIEHLYLRVIEAELLDEVVIATTISKEDDILCEFLATKGIKFFRGSEKDVLGRYVKVAEWVNADVIVRITGDCPLIDPHLIDMVVQAFMDSNYDYMSPRSADGLIRGLDTEVFTRDALNRADCLAHDDASREHVTLYMYKHPSKFNVASFPIPGRLKDFKIRLCVDEIEDFALIYEIYKNLYKEGEIIDIMDVLNLLKAKPHLQKINMDVKQNKV